MAETGVVNEECVPYQSGQGVVPLCMDKCVDGRIIGEGDKVKAIQESIRVLTTPEMIKREILANGPVETGFVVYKDFMTYRSGIYTRNSDEALGGHAVKVVGWGVENGTEYWTCANSWSPKWGEDGFFKIKFGECQIDNSAIAGLPLLQRETQIKM